MSDGDAVGPEPAEEILPPSAPSLPDPSAARALVGRLVRSGLAPESLLVLVVGPLADAVATAAV